MNQDKAKKERLGVRQVLLGSIFLNKEVLRWLPVIGLLTLIGLLIISNRFKGEKILRAIVEVQEEVQELRSESVTIEAELMNMSRYSEVIRELNKRGVGLKQPDMPPIKIKLEE